MPPEVGSWMSRSLLAMLAVASLLAVGVTVPVAGADHCEKRITIYSRNELVAGPPPPSVNFTARTCLAAFGQSVHEDAVLIPQADQVFVRVSIDLGPSVPTLNVVLDGLGFSNQTFVMQQKQSLYGFRVYEMADFVSIPGGANATGTLNATIVVGGMSKTVTYRTV